MTLSEAFKAAFDSLVRTYSPMVIGAALAGLAIILGVPVPEEVATFVTLLVAVLFQMLWYGVLRVIELVRGKASSLLGLGLVKADPTYAKVNADPSYATDVAAAEYETARDSADRGER